MRNAARVNPSNPDAQFALARALELYGKKNTGDELADAQESLQRYKNVLHLAPNYPKVSEQKKADLAALEVPLPEFFFFPGEEDGLFKHLKYSSVYQYVGITRKALTLLIRYVIFFSQEFEINCQNRFSNNNRILWSIFRKYTEQLYTWASSPNSAISQVRLIWSQARLTSPFSSQPPLWIDSGNKIPNLPCTCLHRTRNLFLAVGRT